jgi:crotonobetainyl-CoA:carnitine CoA-transferase CaiB-like acyl-CoA transferase
MRELATHADVLVQNFRPCTMERLGLGEPLLREMNPRLIYVSISGVGESGPYAAKRVYDPIIQGLSGLADLQADPETRRPRMIPRSSPTDHRHLCSSGDHCSALCP